jgi:hypothetical protein
MPNQHPGPTSTQVKLGCTRDAHPFWQPPPVVCPSGLPERLPVRQPAPRPRLNAWKTHILTGTPAAANASDQRRHAALPNSPNAAAQRNGKEMIATEPKGG